MICYDLTVRYLRCELFHLSIVQSSFSRFFSHPHQLKGDHSEIGGHYYTLYVKPSVLDY